MSNRPFQDPLGPEAAGEGAAPASAQTTAMDSLESGEAVQAQAWSSSELEAIDDSEDSTIAEAALSEAELGALEALIAGTLSDPGSEPTGAIDALAKTGSLPGPGETASLDGDTRPLQDPADPERPPEQTRPLREPTALDLDADQPTQALEPIADLSPGEDHEDPTVAEEHPAELREQLERALAEVMDATQAIDPLGERSSAPPTPRREPVASLLPAPSTERPLVIPRPLGAPSRPPPPSPSPGDFEADGSDVIAIDSVELESIDDLEADQVAPGRPAPALESAKPAERPILYRDPLDEGSDEQATNIYDPPVVDAVEMPRGRLVIVGGEHAGKVYYINRAETSVGRGTDNDIVLLDIAASRRHLRIDRHQDGMRMVDLGSGNGTQLNGRRVQEAELFDGDRLEIGNTLLEFSTVGKARKRAGPVPITDPNIVSLAGSGRARRRLSPITWVLIWAGATSALLLIGIFAWRLATGHKEERGGAALAKARYYIEQAEGAKRLKDWDLALQHLEVARQFSADLFDYAAEHQRIQTELAHKRSLIEARALLAAGKPELVAKLVAAIGPDSVYHAEGQKALAEAKRRWVEARASQAEALMHQGQTAQAKAIVEEVLGRDPTSKAALRVKNIIETSAAEGTPPAEVVGRRRSGSSDKRARQDLRAGLRHYREARFEDALTRFQRAVQRKPSSRLLRRARGQAKKVRQFASAWREAERYIVARRPDNAVTALATAKRIDAGLGGSFARRIDAKLAEQYYLQGVRAFQRRNYRAAVENNDRVLALSPGHGLARRLKDKFARQAAELLRKAEQARRSNDNARARTIARMALDLSKPSDPTYRSAYRLLQQLER